MSSRGKTTRAWLCLVTSQFAMMLLLLGTPPLRGQPLPPGAPAQLISDVASLIGHLGRLWGNEPAAAQALAIVRQNDDSIRNALKWSGAKGYLVEVRLDVEPYT